MDTRATKTKPVFGKPAWHGQYQDAGGRWITAKSAYGPICYTTPEYACKGAEACAELAAAS